MDEFHTFSHWLFDRLFTDRRILARTVADWIIAQLEKPVKLLTRPKYEHPSTYETVDPEIAHLNWLEQQHHD